MIRKDFNEGDTYIVTSHRDSITDIYDGVSGIFTGAKYVRDVSFDEAVEIHTQIMQRDFPSMNFTKEMIKDAMNPNEKYFLNSNGEVISYSNHEKPDIFDIRRINGEDIDVLSIEKYKWIKEHNVQPDEDGHFRCWNEN